MALSTLRVERWEAGMFNVGGGEVIVIALVALVFLGPERLPDAVRQIGRIIGEIKNVTAGFEREMRSALSDLDDETIEAEARRRGMAVADPEPAQSPETAPPPEASETPETPGASDQADATVAAPIIETADRGSAGDEASYDPPGPHREPPDPDERIS